MPKTTLLRERVTPIGVVEAFAADVVPAGWVKCNGASLLRTDFPNLFAKIGTTFGQGNSPGDTFQVPDLREEFVRGWADDKTGGPDSGRVFGSSQTDTMQGHKHDIQRTIYSETNNGGGYPAATGVGVARTDNFIGNPIPDGANGSPRTGPDTKPRNVAMLYCIKAT